MKKGKKVSKKSKTEWVDKVPSPAVKHRPTIAPAPTGAKPTSHALTAPAKNFVLCMRLASPPGKIKIPAPRKNRDQQPPSEPIFALGR